MSEIAAESWEPGPSPTWSAGRAWVRRSWGSLCVRIEQRRCLVLGVSCLAVSLLFLLTRLPYLLYYPLPSVQPDYCSYWSVLWQMKDGSWPVFDYRTPGFPMFMKLVLLFSDRLMAIVLAQNLLSLLTALFVTYCAWRTHVFLTPLVAAAVAVGTTSFMQVQVDMSLLTESLFGNCMMLVCAFLLRMLSGRRALPCALASAFMAFSIFARPTGQYYHVIFGLILAYLLWNRWPLKRVGAFALPYPLLLLALMAYNRCTFGRFVLSENAPITFAIGSSMYWAQDEKFPPEVNRAIAQVQERIEEKDRKIIFESWDLDQLKSTYYICKYWDCSVIMNPISKLNLSGPEQTKLYLTITKTAIRKNTHVFVKALVLNLYLYFYDNFRYDAEFYGHLAYMHDLLCVQKNAFGQDGVSFSKAQRQSMLREFYDHPKMENFEVVDRDGAAVSQVDPRVLQKLHVVYGRAYNRLFRGDNWVTALFAIFVLCSLVLLGTRWAHPGAFILWILALCAIGHGVGCSIVSNTPRFSSPMWFMYYLLPALLPVLFICGEKKSRPTAIAATVAPDGPGC